MKIIQLISVISLGFTLCQRPLQAQEHVTSLQVGDPAPPIRVMSWLKGDPVRKFEKGHIYVIEFGGVGCAPCRMSIPHLSALAKKYSNITIVSVFVFENGAFPEDTVSRVYEKRVAVFIHKMGDRVSYRVAVDDPRQYMGTRWLKAAGMPGIPYAFVIDRDSRVAWIGNPTDLDPVLGELTAGIFSREKSIASQRTRDSLMSAVYSHADLKQFPEALEILDRFISEDPSKMYLYPTKFDLLLKMNEDSAYLFGWRILDKECKNSEPALFYTARMILDNSTMLSHPDWDLAMGLTKRALLLSRDDQITAFILEMQAGLFGKQKDFTSAYNAALTAIGLLKTSAVKDQPSLDDFEKKLAGYRRQALE
jgi:thiol-disulfide isomerase/thioredoxin